MQLLAWLTNFEYYQILCMAIELCAFIPLIHSSRLVSRLPPKAQSNLWLLPSSLLCFQN